MTYTRTARPTRPATAGQVEWIEKKTTEHGITYAEMAQRTGHAFEDLTTRTAGTWLDILFGLPPVAREGAATEEGTYARDGRVYRAQRTRDGLRLYVKVYDPESGKFVYDPDGVKFRDLLATDVVTAADALALYGVDVAPKARKTRPTIADRTPAERAQTWAEVDARVDETAMAYNSRVLGPPPGFAAPLVGGEAVHDDADLLAHFGIS